MSEDHRTEPHISTEELRAALTPRADARRNPVLVAEHSEAAETEIQQLREAVAELDEHRRAIDAARADAIELRAALDAARGDASALRAELAQARAEGRERRAALERLAHAGFCKRRKVLAELIERGVL
jgi:septal ring factor EnvC (AmiA/AmiB activator)